MENKNVDRLVKNGAKASVDNKNPQPRRVIATAGKLRVQLGAPNGKTNS
jgi:hypothetical protein